MAEHGEWARKGATLSEVTAMAEYEIERDFIVKGINAGKLEYRDGAIWGNPYLRILRSQLEEYLTIELGPEYLIRVKSAFELKTIKKAITKTKKQLNILEFRKRELELLLNR
jgi:hypothetical protein